MSMRAEVNNWSQGSCVRAFDLRGSGWRGEWRCREAQRLRARRERARLSRREMLKLGLVTGGAAMVPAPRARADDDDPPSPPIVPFQQNLLLPEVATPVRAFPVGPAEPQCPLDVPGFPDLPPPELYEVSLRTGRREPAGSSFTVTTSSTKTCG